MIACANGWTYRVLHLARPHVVELVVGLLGRCRGELSDAVNRILDGLLRRLDYGGHYIS